MKTSSGRGGNADAVVNVATVEFRFGGVLLTEKIFSTIFPPIA